MAQAEISGRLVLRVHDCGNPDHKGPHSTYVIRDLKTRKLTELDVSKLDKDSLKPGEKVKVRGNFKKQDGHLGRGKPFAATEIITTGNAEGLESTDPADPSGGEAAAESDPPIANASPTPSSVITSAVSKFGLARNESATALITFLSLGV